MAQPHTLILSGYGINCEEETKFAFEKAGAHADIVHINDLIDSHKHLTHYQILCIPGGFSYGDDTGSGKALAHRIKNNLWEELQTSIQNDTLILGICNGFQAMTNLGILPALNNNYTPQAALTHNDSARYLDRWVDLHFQGKSVWTRGLENISLPIAHGEGKFYTTPETLRQLKQKRMIAARYITGGICAYQDLKANPNGSLDNIAAITNETGRILGMMPHPERAISITQIPYWPLLNEEYKRQGRQLPKEGPGLHLFRNAVDYFE